MRLRIAFLLVLGLSSSAALPAAIVEVAVGPGNNFSPKFPMINVGDTVRWTLMGGTHNVNSDDDLFRSGDIGSGWGPFTHVFNDPGEFGYHCENHGNPGSGMFGTITVGGGGGSPGALSFTGSANKSVNEGAGNITLTVQRAGGDDGAVSVQYETVNNGSADFPDDYIQTNGTLNWADNDDNNKTFQVPIVNDTDIEANETFSVQLISPGGGATLGSPNVVNVTINDNDAVPGGPGAIQFTSSTANAGEGDANVSLTAQRVGGTNGSVSVSYATADGSALAGGDYVATNGTLSWGNGDSSDKSFAVPIVGDTVEEASESFTATLSAPTGGATLGSPTTSTVTIADDDITCEPCVADATTLCLAGGSGDPNRFQVRVTWTNFEDVSGPGMAVPFTDDSGFFYFFDPDNLELLVKMVNTCGSVYDSFWFYYAAASNVGLEYEIVDTTACVTKPYSNPRGTFASFGDTGAFETCAAAAAEHPSGTIGSSQGIDAAAIEREISAGSDRPKGREAEAGVDPRSPFELPLVGEGDGCTPCVSDATTLCLAGGSGDPNRFQVRVTWTNFEDVSGPGMAVPFTDDSGFFYFFDPDNLELLVKMVNTCGSVYDSFWFYYAAASNVGLEYEIVDTTACVTKPYSNPRGTFASFGDTGAFETCAAAAAEQP